MGLLDNLMLSSNANFGGQNAGLLDMLRTFQMQQSQYQPSAGFQDPATPPVDAQPSAGQNPIAVGNYQMPRIGDPQQFAVDPAALPQNAQATQGQLPTAQQPPSIQVPSLLPQSPGIGDRLMAGFQGFANAGGLLPALAGGITGLATGQRTDKPGLKLEQIKNAYTALVAGGVPPAQAMAAVQSGNNDILKYTMDKYGKTDKFRPATPAEREAAGLKDGQPMFINTTTNEPKFGPASTNVSTTIQSGEKSYDVDQGKEYSQAFSTMQKAGRDAFGAIGNLNKMSKLIEDPNFYSGTGGESITSLKRAAVALGINDANTAAPNELFQKIAKKTVLDAAGGSLGTGFSNADRSFLEGTVPNLENTREGNRQIIQIAQKVQARNIEVARMAREYAKAHGGRIDLGFDEQLSQYAAQNPLFPASDTPAAPSAPPVPGAKQAPDGKFYVSDPNRPGKYLQVVQ